MVASVVAPRITLIPPALRGGDVPNTRTGLGVRLTRGAVIIKGRYMADYQTEYYCPSCGEASWGNPVWMSPGDFTWTCPEGGEQYVIKILFVPKEEG